MKPGIASLLALFAVPFFWFNAPAHAAQSTREEMESAQTDGFGMRRGKRRGEEEWLEPNRLRREEFARGKASAAGAMAPAQSAATQDAGASDTAPPGNQATDRGSGVVTSGTGSSGNSGSSAGKSGGGIVTGLGAPGAGGKHGHERGHAQRSGAGIVTGIGPAVTPVAAGVAKPGAGIVTGTGGPPGHANAHGRGRGGR